MGNYRLSSILFLNKSGAGIETVPCVVRPALTSTDRLKLQLSENNERENMSPMDKAVAMKDLLDADVPRPEIRAMFSTPGGRKGALKNEPCSNAHLNMLVSFLEFPKAIQEKIHDGRVGTAFAYKLYKRPKEEWDTILTDAEALRIKDIDQEEKEEKKYLEDLKSAEESKAKADTLDAAAKEAKDKLMTASRDTDATNEAEVAALKSLRAGAANDEEKKKKEAEYAAAQAASKAKIAEVEAAKKEADKAAEKAKKARELVDAKYRKIQEARLKAQKKGGAVGPKDLKKLDEKNAPAGVTPLNAVQMRQIIDGWANLAGSYPKVQAIAQAIQNMFSGVDGCLTDKQAYSKIAVITGEKEQAKSKKA